MTSNFRIKSTLIVMIVLLCAVASNGETINDNSSGISSNNETMGVQARLETMSPDVGDVALASSDPNPADTKIDVQFDMALSAGGPSSLYFEDFNDGLAQNWQPIVPTQWQVISGEYCANAGATDTIMQSTFTGNVWTDCSIQTTIRRTGGTSSAAVIVLRASPDFNWSASVGSAYLFGISGDGYYYVAKYVSGIFTFIQSWTTSPYLNTGTASNVVKANIYGSTIKVLFNGNLEWSGSDSSIVNAGNVALMGYSNGSPETIHYFDDFIVERPIVYLENFNTNPGWTTQGEWAFGHPLGLGGLTNGFPDPANGFTGSNVYGVNLSGDYSVISEGGPYYLTTSQINCENLQTVQLKFMRWLNTDYQPYEMATVEASSNGYSWTTIWQNGDSEIADSGWVQCEYDISFVAAKQPIVYIRWGYQTFGGVFPYSGWNIDDVQVTGSLVERSWNFDTNPGWTTQGEWAYGQPLGLGALIYGYPDPANGYTGSNVYGVNLSGDYSTFAGGPYYLTTGKINCENLQTVQLKFMRWLNTDYQPFVSTTVEVSSDGYLWNTIWQNGYSAIADWSWVPCIYDISAIAANQPTVYVRWGYQTFSYAFPYSGWNIDDVQVTGILGKSWNFDTNPGWTTQSQWEFGVPLGLGGVSYGYPDPASGYTGSNVYGVNLSGDYSTLMGEPYYLTTDKINCIQMPIVQLKFMRWLNTDYQPYAKTTIEASSDGSSWTTIWQNEAFAIADSSWVPCIYDISSVATNQPTVYVRWGYQIGDGAYAYSGWNIDDVQIIGSLLTGTVNLSDFTGGDITTVPVTVEMNGTPYNLYLDAYGKFTIHDISAGVYDVRIKGSHWLAKMITGFEVNSINTVIDPVTLINGDVVDNNEVDFSDINAARAAYGSFPGDLTWNEQADVDGSGEVDFTDINIVRKNYGEIGD